jgi:hypothetical protein
MNPVYRMGGISPQREHYLLAFEVGLSEDEIGVVRLLR